MSASSIQSTPASTPLRTGSEPVLCIHCASLCPPRPVLDGEKAFCCPGCRAVYALLHDEGLETFYQLRDHSPGDTPTFLGEDAYDLLENPKVEDRLLDYRHEDQCHVTFRIPGIHCTGCVWLLENLYTIVDGFGRTEVDFLRKEVRIEFDHAKLSLADVARNLDRFGYAPDLSLAHMGGDTSRRRNPPDRLALKIGIAGFAFGNSMLLHFPSYLGMHSGADSLSVLFGRITTLLSLPVMIYSASEFWKNSWLALQQRKLSIDLPIVFGICALFLQSMLDLATHSGPGYLDSLSGLVFFLLIGKWYQRRTTDALSFDRDYRSYFPLTARKLNGLKEEAVPVSDLQTGDRIRIRNGELIPADSILLSGEALIDSSFVTGESVPEARSSGDQLYAGGRQTGTLLEMEIIKPVSQSYLTSLWNDAAFTRRESRLESITDTAARYFTPGVLIIALLTGLFWLLHQDPRAALTAVVSVLIVACPCALALSAPFAFGQAMRILGRKGFYLRSADVIDQLSRISHIVFDKTGTLTEGGEIPIRYEGQPLLPDQYLAVQALANQSIHPLCRRIIQSEGAPEQAVPVKAFAEHPGRGVEGCIGDSIVRMGSARWLHELEIPVPEASKDGSSLVWVAIDRACIGLYRVQPQLRKGIREILPLLSKRYRMSLLTGDHARGTEALSSFFGPEDIQTLQSPHDKLKTIETLQQQGARVAMIGDGLNDAGALRQSDAGIAVTDDIQAFVPACDAILDAGQLSELPRFLSLARGTRLIVLFSFGLSVAYNLAGFSLAASNHLTPVVAAILMPLSSITVVSVASLGTRALARWQGVRLT